MEYKNTDTFWGEDNKRYLIQSENAKYLRFKLFFCASLKKERIYRKARKVKEFC
jgi:hypothetical protein